MVMSYHEWNDVMYGIKLPQQNPSNDKILAFIEKENLHGLILTEASESRYYPNGTLASHLLGFTGSDNQGLYGLELFYDDDLSGEDGTNRFLVSIGIFSVVRLERPAQYLISATEHSVPDKECRPAASEENPCCLFRTMAFPVGAFGQSCGTGEGKHSH